ncbi:MAG: metal-dependent hydrolase [Bacteroidota bacterium]
MKISYYGHSAFGVEIEGKHLLIDPFISGNPLASDIDSTQVPADYILLTHGHGDHLGDTIDIANRTGAPVVSNYEIISWLQGKGVEKGFPMNFGGTIDLGFCKVKMVLAIHSSTLPDGSAAGNPCGFVVESATGSFYYSGDTSLHYDMKLLGEMHKLDFAFLCMGDNFTMGVSDSLVASNFINTEVVIGMHYDTMDVLKIDHDASQKLYADAGKTLHLMQIGSNLEI